MTATRRAQWYWSDWLGDQAVRRLSLAERGLWIDLLALASDGNPTGYVCDDRGRPLTLEEICRVTNAASPDEVAHLIDRIVEKGAASRDRTGRLLNRRMVRDAQLSSKRSRSGHVGGVHTALVNKSNRDLVEQMAKQVPRQTEAARRGLIPNRNNLSSETNGLAQKGGSSPMASMEARASRASAELEDIMRGKGEIAMRGTRETKQTPQG